MARGRSGTAKGVSLAKGPVGLIGLVGLLYGLGGLIFASHSFTLSHVPHGAVHGSHWIGLIVNGWSELLFVAAGLALLLLAPVHVAAKGISMLVGGVLVAAAIVAVIRGNGVFGLFAANKLTELVWAAAGVLLLLVALLPRVGGGRPRGAATGGGTRSRPRSAAPAEPADPARPFGEPGSGLTGTTARGRSAETAAVPSGESSEGRTTGARRITTNEDR